MSADVDVATSLVRDAGTLAAQMLRDGLQARRKTSVSDVVSAADHAAEELVVARLRAERPGDGVIGEEGADEPGERTWFVDPVDGTYNFLSGIPVWCSAIALTDDDGLVLGAVYQPTTDELWVGGRDVPTTMNGRRVRSLAAAPLAELSLASYLHPTTLPDDGARVPLLRAMHGAATVRMLGSGSVELASVASGRLGAWVQLDSVEWDWLPGRALVEAAGGVTAVFEAHGHRWHIASNRRAVDELKALINGHEQPTGVVGRLTQLVLDASGRVGCDPRLATKGRLDALPDEIADALVSVASEALDNAVRHAYASSLSVDVALSRGELTLVVRDDGVGPQDEPTRGTGLPRMAGAAESLGGLFTIEAQRPMGTRVTWRVPAATTQRGTSKSR